MDNLEKILEIKVDASSAIKTMADLSKSYQDLKNHEKELQNEIKELSKDEAANVEVLQRKREELIATKEQEKQYSGQISELSRVVQNQLKLDKEQVGSLKSLRAELSNATKEYDSLSRAEREGARGKELQKHINEVTDELKKAEEETQRYQRNVGNYKSALQDAGCALKEAGVQSNTFDKSLKMLNANPIILFLTAIVAVVKAVISAFKGNEEATMALKEALAPLNPIIDAVKRGFEAFAGIIVKVVKGAVEGLTKAITWLMEKLQAIGNWFGADWHFADNFKAGQEAAQAAAVALAEAENKLIKDKRAWVTESAKMDKEIAELREKASNKEKYTSEERLKYLDKAIALETAKAAKEKQLAEESLRVLQLEAARTANDAEMNDKLAEAEARVIEADTKLMQKKRELNQQRQAAVEAVKKEQEAIVNATKEAQEALISLMEEGVEKETALENARFEKQRASLQAKLDAEKNAHGEETELYQAYAAQMEAIEQQHQDKLNKISLQGRQKDVEQEMKTIQMKLDLLKDNLEQEYELKRQMLDKQLELELSKTEYTEEQKELVRQKYAQDVIALEEQKRLALEEQTKLEWSNRIEEAKLRMGEYFDNALEAMELEVEQAREHLDNLHQLEGESDEEFKARMLQAQSDYLNKKKQMADAEIAIEKAKATATAEFAGQLSDLLETVGEDNKEALMLSKTLALAEVAIKQGVAISEAIASAAAGDPYTYALRVASAIASTITAMTKAISSINSAKFSKGTGYVTYPGTKESDGDVVPALLTPGEAVATVKANKMFPGLVQAMNDVAAGVSTPARVFNSSNVVNNYTSQSTLNEIAENTEKRLVVSVEEIHRVEDNVEAIGNLSTM